LLYIQQLEQVLMRKCFLSNQAHLGIDRRFISTADFINLAQRLILWSGS